MNEEPKRSKVLFKLRDAFRWDAAHVAKQLGVTTRTISLWETGEQPIPDARWRHFMLEVLGAMKQPGSTPSSVVVVIAEVDHGGHVEQIPIDAVSEGNYAGYFHEGPNSMVIASFILDRVTKVPTIHQVRFNVAQNQHVVRAIDRWEKARLAAAEGPDAAAFLATTRWLTRKALVAEWEDPELRALKDQVNEATREVDEATDAPESVMREKLDRQDRAIWALIERVEKRQRR